MTLRFNKNKTLKKRQTFALIHWAIDFKTKSSVKYNQFMTFFYCVQNSI